MYTYLFEIFHNFCRSLCHQKRLSTIMAPTKNNLLTQLFYDTMKVKLTIEVNPCSY